MAFRSDMRRSWAEEAIDDDDDDRDDASLCFCACTEACDWNEEEEEHFLSLSLSLSLTLTCILSFPSWNPFYELIFSHPYIVCMYVCIYHICM